MQALQALWNTELVKLAVDKVFLHSSQTLSRHKNYYFSDRRVCGMRRFLAIDLGLSLLSASEQRLLGAFIGVAVVFAMRLVYWCIY